MTRNTGGSDDRSVEKRYVNDPRVRVLRDCDDESPTLLCPHCGNVIAQPSVDGEITGWESICGECESVLFLATVVAIDYQSETPTGEWLVDEITVDQLREVVKESIEHDQSDVGAADQHWGWVDKQKSRGD